MYQERINKIVESKAIAELRDILDPVIKKLEDELGIKLNVHNRSDILEVVNHCLYHWNSTSKCFGKYLFHSYGDTDKDVVDRLTAIKKRFGEKYIEQLFKNSHKPEPKPEPKPAKPKKGAKKNDKN